MLGRWPGVGLRVHRRRALPTATPKGELKSLRFGDGCSITTSHPPPLSPLSLPHPSRLSLFFASSSSYRHTRTSIYSSSAVQGSAGVAAGPVPRFRLPSTFHHDEQSGGYASCSSALLRTHSSLSHSFQYVLSIIFLRIDQR